MESTTTPTGENEGYVYSRFKSPLGGYIYKSLRRAQKSTSAMIPFGDVTFLCRDGKVVTNAVYLGATCSLMRDTFESMSPYEREKIMISVPDYTTEVFAQAITILYGGEATFSDANMEQEIVEALLELGFSHDSLVDMGSGKEPNVCIKRFFEDQGTDPKKESTPVKECPPQDTQESQDQKRQNPESLVDDDEVISLSELNSEEEADLMNISVEEARRIRRMRDTTAPLKGLDPEQNAPLKNATVEVVRLNRRKGSTRVDEEMEVDQREAEETPEVSPRKSTRNKKRANQIEPEHDTTKKSKITGRRRSSRLSESQKANQSEKSAISSSTSSKSKEDAPTNDENTAPASNRSSTRNRQSSSKKTPAETPPVVEPHQDPSRTKKKMPGAFQPDVPTRQTRKKVPEPVHLDVPLPQTRKDLVEPSPSNTVNHNEDSNKSDPGYKMNIELDPEEVVRIKPLEVTVRSSDARPSRNAITPNAERHSLKSTQDEVIAKNPNTVPESKKKRERTLDSRPDSTEQMNGNQPAATESPVSKSFEATSRENQNDATQGSSIIPDAGSTPVLPPEAGAAAELVPNELQNKSKESSESSRNNLDGKTSTARSNVSESGPAPNAKNPANKGFTEKPVVAEPAEHVPKCDSDVTYPPGTENLDTLTRWQRTIEYCNICKIQHKAHGKATRCLTKHGRQRCWICLKVMLTSFYNQHCAEEHGNLPGKSRDIVKCPQCETTVPYSNLKQHAASHLWKIPAKVETLEQDADTHVEQPNATAANIRIKNPSELFEEEETEDELEILSSTTGRVSESVPLTNSTPSVSTPTSMIIQQPPEFSGNRQIFAGTQASTEEARRRAALLPQRERAATSTSSNTPQEVGSASMAPPRTQPLYYSTRETPPPPYPNGSAPARGSNQIAGQPAGRTTTLSSSGLNNINSRPHQGYVGGNQHAMNPVHDPNLNNSSRVVLRSGNSTPSVQQQSSSLMSSGFLPSQPSFAQPNSNSRSHPNQPNAQGSGRQQQVPTMYQSQNQYVLSSTTPLRPTQMNSPFVSQPMNVNAYSQSNSAVSNSSPMFNAAMPPPQMPLRATMQQTVQQIPSTHMGPPQAVVGTSIGFRLPGQRPTTPAPEPYPGTEISVGGIRFTAVEDNSAASNFDGLASNQASSLDGVATARSLEEQESLFELEQYLQGDDPTLTNDVVADEQGMVNLPVEDDDVALNFNYDTTTNSYTCKKCNQMYKLRGNAEDHICLADD